MALPVTQNTTRLMCDGLQIGSAPTGKDLEEVRQHLARHRGSCEAVAAPWLRECAERKQLVDADDFLLPPEALVAIVRYEQAG